MPKQKKVFIALFLGFSLVMIVLPFLVTANDLLTKIVEKNFLYLWVQNNVVPLEAKMM
jgi:Na+-transporting methylmalonyl-CoA/oxaloacetate decarboxylase gamma subunit